MSVYSLLGYRPFKKEIEIKAIAACFLNKELTCDTSKMSFEEKWKYINIHALKIFQTAKQKTWVVSAQGKLICILDDIRLDVKNDLELVRWVSDIEELKDKISFGTSYKNPSKFGIINFGENHKNWYYSKDIFHEDDMAKHYLEDVLIKKE